MPEQCPLHVGLEEKIGAMQTTLSEIRNEELAEIKDHLANGKTIFATTATRLGIVEKVVYGFVGLLLTGLVIGGLTLLLKGMSQ